MPLGGSVLVDRVRLFDLIDRMRVAGSALVTGGGGGGEAPPVAAVESEREARLQLARAEEEVTRLRRELDHRVGEQGLTRVAEERSAAMVEEAERNAARILHEAEERAADQLARSATVAAQQLEEADTYALQLLQRLEEQMSLFLENVRSGAAQLEGKRSPSPQVERYSHEPMIAPADVDGGPGDTPPSSPATNEKPARRFPWLAE